MHLQYCTVFIIAISLLCFQDEPYVQNYIYIALYIIQNTTDIMLMTNTQLQKWKDAVKKTHIYL